jgi:hypothetical protein
MATSKSSVTIGSLYAFTATPPITQKSTPRPSSTERNPSRKSPRSIVTAFQN